MDNKFDIIVVGAGHAGIEAAHAAGKMECNTALVTMSLKTIGRPSCNPSIGGTAKGHIVREIDAMGGLIGLLADRAGLHFKMLNKSKGPAVWSPRAQIDKDLYPKYALDFLLRTKNLTLIKATAEKVIVENGKARGIITRDNAIIYSRAIVFCPGTFLNGMMYFGDRAFSGGRFGEPAAEKITDDLRKYGFESGRLKTGTPPRITADSIDYTKLFPAKGDPDPSPFSDRTPAVKNIISCYTSSTSGRVHDILRTGFDRSPLFLGRIKGTGPRYCPSIEDKINRFADRDSHKILLEPEGLSTNSVYVNGFSTSLPEDVQIKGIQAIPGLEQAKFIRPGYAIEYDFFYPYQLKFSLETKHVENLFFAGQINGTSGYEEAAGQGLLAGINAVQKISGREPFTLSRSESYIGVLVDDLVNKSTEEPYRIFTSLAEYRLLLRQDNADRRLMQYGYDLGLVPEYIYNIKKYEWELIEEFISKSKDIKITPSTANPYLDSKGESTIRDTTSIYNLTKRSRVLLEDLLDIAPSDTLIDKIRMTSKIIEKIQTEIKYEGYIRRQLRDVEVFLKNENKRIPDQFDYNRLTSLSNEAREKLIKVRPHSLGQASRISGVSASDVSILSVYLR
jgi:tRNA uridine 5-carboxymethylaminomethyl modification enzyme